MVTNITAPEMDVDGIVVLGHLPLVSSICNAKINLKNIKAIQFNVKSLSVNDYDGMSAFHIGYVSGMPYSFVTNFSHQELIDFLFQFLGDINLIDQIGTENGWCLVKGTSREQITSVMDSCKCHALVVTLSFLENFSLWANTHLPAEKQLYGAVVWYGFKMRLDNFIDSHFVDRFNLDQVRHSNIHIGIELVKEGHFLGLWPRINVQGSHKYHPLGLKNLMDVNIKTPKTLATLFEPVMQSFEVTEVRAYHPTLMHSRPHTFRTVDVRGLLSAAFMVGKGALVDGNPYRKLKCARAQLKCCHWLLSSS